MDQTFLPQFFPSHWVDECGVFGEPFTEDVSLGYVIREAGGYSYLLKDCFNAMHCSASDLLSSATNNLAKLSDAARIHVGRPAGATVVWIEAEDNFAAVRLLLPKFQALLTRELGGDVLFTVPSRDLILCWNKDAPNNLTSKHAKEALEDYTQDDYALSPNVYVYGDKWPCEKYC